MRETLSNMPEHKDHYFLHDRLLTMLNSQSSLVLLLPSCSSVNVFYASWMMDEWTDRFFFINQK